MPQSSTRGISTITRAMRTTCSQICDQEFGPTCRRAKKYPRRAVPTAIKGRLGARILSDNSALASPSQYLAAG